MGYPDYRVSIHFDSHAPQKDQSLKLVWTSLCSFFQEAQADEEYYDENPDEEEAHEED